MNDFAILAPVLTGYPQPIASARWTALGSAGGFSGSRIWRGDAVDGSAWALKIYLAGMDVTRLEQVHRWMHAARAAGLAFVPALAVNRNGRTTVVVDGRCWECMTWMPGRADFNFDPSDVKLIAAITAIARIHQIWFRVHEAPCPAIHRRHALFVGWAELIRSGWRPKLESNDPIAAHARPAFETLSLLLPRACEEIEPWMHRSVPLQVCVGDVWHDHILFKGDVVTGVIDFAAAKVDHVAADLARMLGSLIPDDHARTETALRAYTAVRPLPNPELVTILDWTGVTASVANWLRRLYFEKEHLADRTAVVKRLSLLVERMSNVQK